MRLEQSFPRQAVTLTIRSSQRNPQMLRQPDIRLELDRPLHLRDEQDTAIQRLFRNAYDVLSVDPIVRELGPTWGLLHIAWVTACLAYIIRSLSKPPTWSMRHHSNDWSVRYKLWTELFHCVVLGALFIFDVVTCVRRRRIRKERRRRD